MKECKETLDITDHSIPVSQFSKGKTSKVIKDVFENDSSYVVLKNNHPKAVLMSIKKFREMNERIKKLEEYSEEIEKNRRVSTMNEDINFIKIKEIVSYDEELSQFNQISDEELNMLVGGNFTR